MLRGNRLQSEEGGGSLWGNNENNVSWDFPGDPVVKTPLANAGGPGFHAWSRKIPHATGQLSPCSTTTEAYTLEPMLHNTRSHHDEKPTHHN